MEVSNISVTSTSSNNEADVVLHLSSVALVGVSVTLAMAHVVGEDIELSVENSQVIDVFVKEGLVTTDVNSLEPVNSHGSEHVIHWLALRESTLNRADDNVLFSSKSLDSVIIVVSHASVSGSTVY